MNRIMLGVTVRRWRQLILQWDFPVAVGFAVLLGVTPDFRGLEWLYLRLLWIEVTVAAALLGFVFAGIAIMMALLKDEFLTFVYDAGKEGFYEEVWPFWLTGWLVVAVILGGIGAIGALSGQCELVQRIAVGAVSFLLAFAVFSIVPLVLFIFRYAELREMYQRREGESTE